jgi:hypothetical protein
MVIKEENHSKNPKGLCIFLPCAFPSIRDERRGKDDATGRGRYVSDFSIELFWVPFFIQIFFKRIMQRNKKNYKNFRRCYFLLFAERNSNNFYVNKVSGFSPLLTP